MKCTFCESDALKGVKGPPGQFICFACVDEFDVTECNVVAGVCNFCSHEIGQRTGVFSAKKARAVALNPDTAALLCDGCGKLCKDIAANQT